MAKKPLRVNKIFKLRSVIAEIIPKCLQVNFFELGDLKQVSLTYLKSIQKPGMSFVVSDFYQCIFHFLSIKSILLLLVVSVF